MEISIQTEKTRFNKFINVEGNTNIVFSGKYGVGKTFFINEFFKENESKFLKLYISPVNYSIANNADIFEYIKVNILFQLLENNYCALNDRKPTLSSRLVNYIKKHGQSIILSLLDKVATIEGANVDDNSTIIIKSLYILSSFWDKAESTNNDDKHTDPNIEDFVQNLSYKKGSIYENDIITQLIKQIIGFIKEDKKNQIVLVIDDLDRIDPEHIFRILNILSAHNNFCESGLNKFGIDKTILVCDITNIRNIYKTKYGINVDFNGYIDKFYSTEIFHFDNTINVINTVCDILCSMKSEHGTDLIDLRNFASKSCQSLLKALLKSNKLNLRTLLKINGKTYDNTRILRLSGITKPINDFISLDVFDFLKNIYGSIESLEEVIQGLTTSDIKSYEEDISIGFIALADYENNKFKSGAYNYKEFIGYALNNSSFPDLISNTHDFWINNKDKLNTIEILKKAFDNYKKYMQ